MADIQSILSALGALNQKEREHFLVTALSQQPGESMDFILQKLDLTGLPVNTRVRLVFAMEMFPLAHSYRAGPNRELHWVVTKVPEHLRPLVYATSRLITEFQETLTCLQNGRGDFVKVFSLLNPENMMEMLNRFQQEMSDYTNQLRDANGRFNRPRFQRRKPITAAQGEQEAKPQQDEQQPTPESESVEAAAPKPKRSTARKAKTVPAQTPDPAPEQDAADATGDVPANTDAGEAKADHAEEAPAPDAVITPAKESEPDMSAFGFDVLALAGGSEQPAESGEDGK